MPTLYRIRNPAAFPFRFELMFQELERLSLVHDGTFEITHKTKYFTLALAKKDATTFRTFLRSIIAFDLDRAVFFDKWTVRTVSILIPDVGFGVQTICRLRVENFTENAKFGLTEN